jgi:hypothetical protein
MPPSDATAAPAPEPAAADPAPPAPEPTTPDRDLGYTATRRNLLRGFGLSAFALAGPVTGLALPRRRLRPVQADAATPG